MPSLSTQARIASIAAFAEAREIRPIRQRPSLPGQMQLPFGGDDCGREGGRFAKGNTCQEGAGMSQAEQDSTQRLFDRLSSTTDQTIALGPSDVANIPGFDKAREVVVTNPSVTSQILRTHNISTKQLAALSVAGEPGSVVTVGGRGDRVVAVRSKIPFPVETQELIAAIDNSEVTSDATQEKAEEIKRDTGARISIDMTLGGSDSQIHYGLFQVSPNVQRAIAKHAEVQSNPDADWSEEEKALAELGASANRFLGGAIFELMGNSLIAAEEAGIAVAETSAAGTGSGEEGQGAGRADSFTFKGYSLWPRFGFDGPLPGYALGRISPILDEILSEGPDSPRRGVLSEDGWRKWQEDRNRLTIQDLVETPRGERIWRDYGSSAHMSINFADKESKGYKKFTEAKKLAARAKKRREGRALSQWLWDTDFRYDPEIFFVERRTAEFLARRSNCGTGAGGFQKGNTCGGAAADVAASAAKGAVSGAAAAAGQTLAFPPAVAAGAASGAAIGVVKGLYDASRGPTRAGKAIAAVGSTDEKIASLVKGLGGSPQSVARSGDGKTLSLSVRDSKGDEKYSVSMTSKTISVTPSKASLSDSEVSEIKKIAENHVGKPVQVSVDKAPASTLAKLAKAGFSIGLSAAGALVAGLVATTSPALVGTAVEVTTGIDVEKSLKALGL